VNAARVLATMDREAWTEVIASCIDCGRAHRFHVGHDERQPITRRSACGRSTFVLLLDEANANGSAA